MATDLATLGETVIDLEVRLAYQDRLIATLDELVRALYARVDELAKEVRELREGAAPAIGPAAEPPPHY
jgi:uncharacterized coiled-coil protein SlyX